jgi:hypothetical protein
MALLRESIEAEFGFVQTEFGLRLLNRLALIAFPAGWGRVAILPQRPLSGLLMGRAVPLKSGSSRETISRNISELTHHGSRRRSHRQIVAIALANARRGRRARRRR